MKIFPYSPSEFSADFVSRMRKHPDIIQMPSPRQVLTIPPLLLARFLRNGNKLSVNDYIEIGVATSFPNNQDLAKKVAFQILFPNYSIKDIDSFLEKNKGNGNDAFENIIGMNEEYENQQIAQLCEEIECAKFSNRMQVSKIEEFVEIILQNRSHEPFKSSLVFYDDTSDFYLNEVSSMEQLLELTKQKVREKINSLKPHELTAIKELGLSQLVETNSRKKWERITNKALNNKKIYEDLFILKTRGTFEDLIKTVKFLRDTDALKENKLQKVENILSGKILTMEHVFHAAYKLNELPKFDLNQILMESIYTISLDRNLKLAQNLDHYFGANYRKSLFELLNREFYKSESFKERFYQNADLVDSICKYSYSSSSWVSLLEKILLWEISNAKSAFHPYENFKILINKFVQCAYSCENLQCSHIISQFLPRLVDLSILSCKVPTELKDVVDFLKIQELRPNIELVRKIGHKIEMPEEEVAELIEPAFEVLKKYMIKANADLKIMQHLMDKIKSELNYDKILELMQIALGSNNREALAVLAHYNLEQSLEAAQSLEGRKGVDKIISCLTAGNGENLIKQWFLHRDKIPQFLKDKIKDIARQILVELGINYSKSYLGSLATGAIQTNLIRPYEIGDSFEDIDLESTMFNLLEKGKPIDHITYDDFLVFISSSGLRSICIEMDISESMTGEKLAYMAICVTMLVYGMRKDELGITLFEKGTHVLKEINQNVDLEDLADELLSMKARGTTFVEKALHWARDQFKRAFRSKNKINIMFTDAEIYDIPNAAETLRAFKSLGVDFILVCPEQQFNMKESEKIVKMAGGQLLTVKNWENFPELITNIINTRF